MSPAKAWVLPALFAACSAVPASNPYLSLESAPVGAETRLTLRPAPGARINARLKPALERTDGSILRFEGASVTADSSYFTAPPVLMVHGDARGIVRASVCPEGERVCRMVEVRAEGRGPSS